MAEVIRIAGSRPIYKPKPDLSGRGNRWDERFILGRIPDYDAFQDRHCLGYMLTNSTKKKRTQISPIKVRKPRSPVASVHVRPVHTLSVKRMPVKTRKPAMIDSVLRQLRSNLVELWSLDRVPEELWAPVAEAIDRLEARDKAEALRREVEDVEQKKSVLQSLIRAISSREQALIRLSTLISASSAIPHVGQFTAEAKTLLSSLRLMTLHVVECAAAYKDYLLHLGVDSRRRTPVLHNSENYLLRLTRDLDYLGKSQLAEFFDFAEKGDPFLLIPARARRKTKDEVTIPVTLIGRIKAAEKVLKAEISAYRDGNRETEERQKPEQLAKEGESAKEHSFPQAVDRSSENPASTSRAEEPREPSVPSLQIEPTEDVNPLSSTKPVFLSKKQSESDVEAVGSFSAAMPSSPVKSDIETPHSQEKPPVPTVSDVPAAIPTPPLSPKVPQTFSISPPLPSKDPQTSSISPPLSSKDPQTSSISLPLSFKDPQTSSISPPPAIRIDPQPQSESASTPRQIAPAEVQSPVPPAESPSHTIPEPIVPQTDAQASIPLAATANPTLSDISSAPTPIPTVFPDISDIEVGEFQLTEMMLKAELEAYLASVPEEIRATFWDERAFANIAKESYPAWVQMKRAGARVGVMSFAVDTLNASARRVFIHHISAHSVSDFECTLDSGLRHIWTTIHCSEVRICLNYRDIAGRLEVDPAIKALIAGRHFRWKNLTNTADGRRVIIMALPRPAEIPVPQQAEDFFSETVVLRYAAGVEIDGSAGVEVGGQCEKRCSMVGIAACLKDEEEEIVPGNEAQTQFVALRSQLTRTFQYPDFKESSGSDQSSVLSTVHSQSLELSGFTASRLLHAACFSVALWWASFRTAVLEVQGRLYRYVRVTDAEVNIASVDGLEVMLVPIDSQFNFLIVTGEGVSTCDPWGKATAILQKLTSGQDNFSQTTTEIWLPGFASTLQSSTLSDLIGLRVGTDRTVTHAAESALLKLHAPLHSTGNAVLKPSGNAAVVASDFLIGNTHAAVLNTSLDELAPVPYLAHCVRIGEFTPN